MTHSMLVRLVRRRMENLGLTPYQLHQRLGARVSKQTVYNFIAHGKVVRSDNLLVIIEALGLTVAQKDQRKARGLRRR